MNFFQLINSLDPEISSNRCKIHLAVRAGKDDPLDHYFAGDFDEWQTWQTRRNFERELVLSLIQLPEHLNYAQINFASVAAFVAGWRSS